MAHESVARTMGLALLLCGICSVMVSSAAVMLRPAQERNRTLEVRRNILVAAGFGDQLAEGKSVDELFQRIEVKLVDLSSGEYAEQDPASFDQRTAARDAKTSIQLPPDKDPASIRRRANLAPVYLVREGDALQRIVLPVHGKGLWSTMYGFLALEADTQTVANLVFYEHGETPGLGGEIENPRWLSSWPGKQWLDAQGKPALDVIKGRVNPADPKAKNKVDGLSGATLTANGVEYLMRFWAGEMGFGPYLERLRSKP